MVSSHRFGIETRGNCDIHDITPRVARLLGESNIKNGAVTVMVVGSTAAITTMEYESGLIADFKEMWDRLIPRDLPYKHNGTWDEANGHSHLRASMVGPSVCVPFIAGVMTLGTWQQIVLFDFDIEARRREIVVQIVGN